VDVLSSQLTEFPQPVAGHASCRDINRSAPLRYRRFFTKTISRWRLRVPLLLKSAACSLQTLQQAPLFLIPCPLRLGIGPRASRKVFGPSAFHVVSNRQVSFRDFRPVMLAGLPGQPGSHDLSITRRSWSSPVDSAALTASLPTFSRGQMKCLPVFRLVASICSSHRSDNHPAFRHRSRL